VGEIYTNEKLNSKVHLHVSISLENGAHVHLYANKESLKFMARGILDGIETLEQKEVTKGELQSA
jgi:hypothetical protein